jgi:glutamate formiminotransferase / 5-formyltetrahydrofolate cyclo-ligase
MSAAPRKRTSTPTTSSKSASARAPDAERGAVNAGSEFEIVPNVSEGRDLDTIAACVAAMEREGARVVHRTSDAHHNRSVITAVGSGSQVVAAAVALARVAVERIDVRRHRGAHPRIGALDVLPFVPLGESTLDDAVTLAHRAAARIWRETGVPSYLYGAAASAAHREHLAAIRRGEFEGLGARLAAEAGWHFDFGDAPHPSAGAVAVGARPLLIAFNVELASGELALAKRIARTLRGSSGGLRTLKCLGLRLDAERVQVSCNLTDVDAVPLYRVTELVRRAAARAGVAVRRSELIGLAPNRAVERVARAYETAENVRGLA